MKQNPQMVISVANLTRECLTKVDPIFFSQEFHPALFFSRYVKAAAKKPQILDHVG